MREWLRQHVLAWTTTSAATLTAAQLVAPRFMDAILDIIVVALVWVAAKLAAKGTTKR